VSGRDAFGPLVSATWLREHLRDPDLRVVDLRWYLDGRSGREAYSGGHIPGAVFVDLDRDLTGPSGAGRHPLPSAEQVTAAMRRAGVSRDTRVVVYDDAGGSVAARLWWLLRWFGHGAVAVLDGGLDAWEGPLEKDPAACPPGDFAAREPDPGQVVRFEEMRELGAGARVLDARAPERYRGEREPIDPRAGHVPGARSAFWKDNLRRDGRFLDAESLRARFRELGVESGEGTIAYCGSGVNACHDLLALEVAGLPGARLYAGSWSDWSSHPDAPVATGGEPGGA
jgi:thiosulfate/3-mercaptopyruvate sulfurtransferase